MVTSDGLFCSSRSHSDERAEPRACLARLSRQSCVDRVQKGGAGERFLEERDAALQHFAFGYELAGVTGHVYDFQVRARGVQTLDSREGACA
jgi:hypothetical protein